MSYAFGLVSEYLSLQWSERLKESLGVKVILCDIYKVLKEMKIQMFSFKFSIYMKVY